MGTVFTPKPALFRAVLPLTTPTLPLAGAAQRLAHTLPGPRPHVQAPAALAQLRPESQRVSREVRCWADRLSSLTVPAATIYHAVP